MKWGVVAPQKGGCGLGREQSLRIWVLVNSQYSDGVAMGVHAGSGGIGSHLTGSVHPAGVMDWQHHPLSVDWVTRVHAHSAWISLFLFC